MSSSNSPCAACKCLRRKCTQECVFAPYFPADQPQKFAYVHKVFGASNVTKLLNELNVSQREDAVNSLAYEAETRLRDPVYGCVGYITILQHKLDLLQKELASAKKELAAYMGPHAMVPTMMQPPGAPAYMGNPSMSTVVPYNMMPMMGIPTGASGGGPPLVIRDHQSQQQQQQQAFDAQQLAAAVAARERQEMIRAYEQQQIRQQQQQQLEIKFDAGGFDGVANSVSPSRYNPASNVIPPPPASPSLALGSFDNPYQMQAHQLSLQPQQGQVQDQQELAQEQKPGSEERGNNNNNGGPSC
ncbi:protein LATERAL ORGAN BOUNDARIES-like [Rhodamnia argentea]|uniref:Protein LATERAL ORGAN BOUNDARIES-like n=1 Tax=Rhodamnia argentea TaxID=178133 RepID=A0ABM3GX64_9MYRT|nr:protein LATERAL ORGAN BOUNDARIES-like [Rhodamnia argentea]